MQIEPPETIHFPIHSLQELQEQRGGLRVSALGSATVPRALAGVFGVESCLSPRSALPKCLSLARSALSSQANL